MATLTSESKWTNTLRIADRCDKSLFPLSVLCLVSQPVYMLVISLVVDSAEEAKNVNTCSRCSILRYSVEYIIFFVCLTDKSLFLIWVLCLVSQPVQVLVISFAAFTARRSRECFTIDEHTRLLWNVRGITKGRVIVQAFHRCRLPQTVDT